jgi:hypothetical protein
LTSQSNPLPYDLRKMHHFWSIHIIVYYSLCCQMFFSISIELFGNAFPGRSIVCIAGQVQVLLLHHQQP